MTPPIIDVRGLTIRVRQAPERTLVRELDLTLPAQGTVALIGTSGSGKTLTARAILDLLPPAVTCDASSSICIDGQALAAIPPRERPAWRRRMFGVVPAGIGGALDPVRSVRAQAALIDGMAPGPAPALEDALAMVGLDAPARFLDRYPHQLSGGEAQRVGLALALRRGPRLLIVDELTTALDAIGRRELIDTLRAVRQRTGTAMLLITHDLDVAVALADEIIVLEAGSRVESTAPTLLRHSARHPATRALLAAWPTLDQSATPATAAPMGAPLLRTEGLTVTHGGQHAVHDATLTIHAGERLAIVGRSGSGKSTLLRSLVGLERPAQGGIWIDDTPLAAQRGRHWRRHLQWLMQDAGRSLDPRLTVTRCISEARAAHALPTDRQRVEQLLASVELPPSIADRHPHALSTGQRQRVALARALAVEPRLLLLDEPLTGLDPVTAAAVAALLARVHAATGVATLTVLHDLAFATMVADRVIVMHHGAIVEDAPTAQLLSAPGHAVTRALYDAARTAALSAPSSV